MKHIKTFEAISKKKNDVVDLKKISEDFKDFKPDGDRGNDIELSSNSVSKDFRNLGNWIDDEENSYEYEDEIVMIMILIGEKIMTIKYGQPENIRNIN